MQIKYGYLLLINKLESPSYAQEFVYGINYNWAVAGVTLTVEIIILLGGHSRYIG